MKLWPSPPIRSSEKTRPVWWSTQPIGSESTNCDTKLDDTSSQRSRAGEEQSSKLVRSVLGPDWKKATPPVLTLSCFNVASLGFQSTPIEGSPALLPRVGGER